MPARPLFLIDLALYLNHMYLTCVLLAVMLVVPAHRAFSIDAWLRPGAQRHAAGHFGDGLKVVGLQHQLDVMAAHDVLQFRPAEIGPGGGQTVEAGKFDHDFCEPRAIIPDYECT